MTNKSFLVKGVDRIGRLRLLLILLAAGLGAVAYLYVESQQEIQRLRANPQETAAAQTQETIDAVGKLMVLPTDETPTVATVTDVEKLKTQPFFAKAKNGDKVLIYTKNRLAILYDPAANKIVAVGTVNLGNSGE